MGKQKPSKQKQEEVCNCTDFYKCTCGKRPERPSRGHKWDPVEKKWAGKGHKQKGAGSATTSGNVEKVTNVGKTSIKSWQRLPSEILEEICKKESRPRPIYNINTSPNGIKKCKIVVLDSKLSRRGKEYDLVFCPAAGCMNEEQAKEESAILAIMKLAPSIAHDRRLPEPYKTTYLNATSAITIDTVVQNVEVDKAPDAETNTTENPSKASASKNLTPQSSFHSKAEIRDHKDKIRQKRNAAKQRQEALEMANKDHPVFLSPALRSKIQKLLTSDGSSTKNGYIDCSSHPIYDEVIERLCDDGFKSSQAIDAFQNQSDHINTLNGTISSDQLVLSAYEFCLQWLYLHIPEDELPKALDPRGRTLDVIKPNKSVSSCSLIWKISEVYGTSHLESKSLITEAGFNAKEDASQWSTSQIIDCMDKILWEAICNSSDLKKHLSTSETLKNENNLTLAAEELEALSAIFGDECIVEKLPNLTKITIQVQSSTSPFSLDIFTFDGLYPSTYPMVFIRGCWNDFDRSSVSAIGSFHHIQLATFMSTLSCGDPMIYDLYNYVSEIDFQDESSSLLPSDFKDKSTILSYFKSRKHDVIDSNTSLTLHDDTTKPKINSQINHTSQGQKPKNQQQKRCRPKGESSFWTKLSKDTPNAIPFPKISSSLKETREKLPACKARSTFIEKYKAAEQSNRVLLLTGETGCGKSTQIPQFLLEEFPTEAKIIVTQPRRLAATGVAHRVAEERGEERPGLDSVGYIVRGDVAISASTRLLFCTTGILLRQLQSDSALDCITHLCIDECHERSMDTDILLALLKVFVLPSNPRLNVILMSATMDADRFATYFGSNTPRMHIPGFTHPVKEYSLDDILGTLDYIPPKKKGMKRVDSTVSSKSKASSQEDVEDVDTISERIARMDPNIIDYNLIALLLKYILQKKEDKKDYGSILVFLPGAPEIFKADETIRRILKNIYNLQLMPLHGGLDPKDQRQVFQTSRAGRTKIILATNIAETSITIPDCTVVIDTCREKQSSFDASNRMPCLIECFSSRDSLRQRRGRAGRVQSGQYYSLISNKMYQQLPHHGVPEIKRCALDQVILSLLFLGVENGTSNFLSQLLDPPSLSSVNSAFHSLEQLGALTMSTSDDNISLTPLGCHLAGIPAPPAIGKLLVVGSLLGVRNAALAMAAGMSAAQSPFSRIDTFVRDIDDATRESNEAILQERQKLFVKCGGNSDHTFLAAIYLTWDSFKGAEKRQFCNKLGLVPARMRDIKLLVDQYDGALTSLGFDFSSEKESNINSKSFRIIRSCVVAALAPSQVIRVKRPALKYHETVEGSLEKDGVAKELKLFVRKCALNDKVESKEGFMDEVKTASDNTEERVYFHPSSMNFKVGNFSCPWLVYHQLIRTSKPFIRDATECSSYALLLFGGKKIDVNASNELLIIDDWIRLSANARTGVLVKALRSKIDELLAFKFSNPECDVVNNEVMKLIVELIVSDGHGV